MRYTHFDSPLPLSPSRKWTRNCLGSNNWAPMPMSMIIAIIIIIVMMLPECERSWGKWIFQIGTQCTHSACTQLRLSYFICVFREGAPLQPESRVNISGNIAECCGIKYCQNSPIDSHVQAQIQYSLAVFLFIFKHHPKVGNSFFRVDSFAASQEPIGLATTLRVFPVRYNPNTCSVMFSSHNCSSFPNEIQQQQQQQQRQLGFIVASTAVAAVIKHVYSKFSPKHFFILRFLPYFRHVLLDCAKISN